MPILTRDMRPASQGGTGLAGRHETDAVLADSSVVGIGSMATVITAVSIYRFDDIQAAHWEMYLTSDGPSIKVDLMEAGYRVLYGAAPRVGPDGTLKTLTLDPTRTLGEVIHAVAEVAAARGNWTGTLQYNCQDFVIALMKALKMTNAQIFPYELRRAAMKRNPPMLLDRDADDNLRQRI